MMTINWPTVILCAAGIAMLLTVVIIPQVLQVSLSKRLFDRPNARKIHNGIVPRLGGFAFLPVFLLTLGIMMIVPAMQSQTVSILGHPHFINYVPEIVVLLGAMTILFLTGLYDDLLGVKYGIKFIVQLISAVMLVEAGSYIIEYNDLFGITATSAVMGKIITGFLIIYIVNALNLIDGIDGLAAGLGIITLSFYGLVLYMEHQYLFSLLSWVGVGTLFVFWVFNVFGSKRRHTKIFMGDIGSLSIGILIAFLMIAVGRVGFQESAWHIKPMVLALSPLVIPLLDVIRVFCIRISLGRSPFLPDKRHIHHLMMLKGMKMKAIMIWLLIIQIGLVALNLWISEFADINVILIIDTVLYFIGVMYLMITSLNKEK